VKGDRGKYKVLLCRSMHVIALLDQGKGFKNGMRYKELPGEQSAEEGESGREYDTRESCGGLV